MCLDGARWVDQNILGKIRAPELRVYAIWVKRLREDKRTSCDPKIFDDPRATIFWDEKQILGKWLAEAEGLDSTVVWDTYYLHGPDARWGSAPAPLVASGFPVVNFRADLRKYLREIVKVQR